MKPHSTTSRRKKIIFAGAYGIYSHGDDAALVVLIDQLRQQFGDFEGVVLSRHLDQDYSIYGLRSVKNLEYETKAESLGKWFQGFNYDDDTQVLNELFGEIATADLLVLGAGNFLVDYAIELFRGPVPYFSVLSIMARMNAVPVMWYGISVGPLSSCYGQKLSYFSSTIADCITLRDPLSLHNLKALGYKGEAKVLPDAVMGLFSAKEQIANNPLAIEPGFVAISVRYLPQSPEDNLLYQQTLAAFADYLVEELGKTVVFIPQQIYQHGNPQEDDRVVARQIHDLMAHQTKVVLVEQALDVYQTCAAYVGANFAIATRLHANVCSAIQGVPSIAIDYNPKVASFMEYLNEEEYVLAPNQMSLQKLKKLTNQLVENQQKIKQNRITKVEQGCKDILTYSELVVDCLEASS